MIGLPSSEWQGLCKEAGQLSPHRACSGSGLQLPVCREDACAVLVARSGSRRVAAAAQGVSFVFYMQ